MMNKHVMPVCGLILMSLILAACGTPAGSTSLTEFDLAGTIVAGTIQAGTDQASQPAQSSSDDLGTSTPSFGSIEGQICYPSSGSKDLRAFFVQTDTDQITEISISAETYSYSLDLTPGIYIAYAWTTDFSNSGSYSACGMDATCDDATPLPFTVNGGQTLSGVDLCDWSHDPYEIPYPPGFQTEEELGQINGEITGYPYGNMPQMSVVIYGQDSPYWFWVGTSEGQVYFSFTELSPGTYQVVAYDPAGNAGGVPALVKVTAGESAYAVISDWSGSYPPKPASVP